MNRLKCAVCPPLLVGLFLIFTLLPSQGYAASSEPASLSSHFPISFEPNLGQTDAQVRFLTRNRRFRMYLTANSTAAGDAYVTGNYHQASGLSAKFPCTAGAYPCIYAGNNDAFVMKFNPE